MNDRPKDVQRALTLSVASVVIGAVVATLAVPLGLGGGSLSLVAFGVDAAIDATASLALVWRFRIEGRDAARAERVEHVAERLVGAVLLVAAIALTLGAVQKLGAQSRADVNVAHILLLAAALLVLPPLAATKRAAAIRLGSRALMKDAVLTAAAAMLALVALVAALLAEAAQIWWADPVGTLVIAAVLAREGWTSVRAPTGTGPASASPRRRA